MSNDTEAGTELAILDHHSPLARLDATTLQAESKALVEIMENVLIEGSHYGQIPNTSKPSLFKAGAEWLLKWANYGHRLDLVEVERDGEGRKYGVTYKATVMASDGRTIATCDGYCGYDEPDREAHVKTFRNGGSKQIPRSPWNTIIKMAEKRALVGAALQACGASGLFTQDLEDYSAAVNANDHGGGVEPDPEPEPADWWVDNGWADEPTARQEIAALREVIKGLAADVKDELRAYLVAESIPADKVWTRAQFDVIKAWLTPPSPDGHQASQDAPGAAVTNEGAKDAPEGTAEHTAPSEDDEATAEAHFQVMVTTAEASGLATLDVEVIHDRVKVLNAKGVDDELTRLRKHCKGNIKDRRRRLELALLQEYIAAR